MEKNIFQIEIQLVSCDVVFFLNSNFWDFETFVSFSLTVLNFKKIF